MTGPYIQWTVPVDDYGPILPVLEQPADDRWQRVREAIRRVAERCESDQQARA